MPRSLISTLIIALFSFSLLAADDAPEGRHTAEDRTRAGASGSDKREAVYQKLLGDNKELIASLIKELNDYLRDSGVNQFAKKPNAFDENAGFWGSSQRFLNSLVEGTMKKHSIDEAKAIDMIVPELASLVGVIEVDPRVSDLLSKVKISVRELPHVTAFAFSKMLEARNVDVNKLLETIGDIETPLGFRNAYQAELRRRLKSPVITSIVKNFGGKPIEMLKTWETLKSQINGEKYEDVARHISKMFKQMTDSQEMQLAKDLEAYAFKEGAGGKVDKSDPKYAAKFFARMVQTAIGWDEMTVDKRPKQLDEFAKAFFEEKDRVNSYHDLKKKALAGDKAALANLKEGWDSETVIRWAMNEARGGKGKELEWALKLFADKTKEGKSRLEFVRDQVTSSYDDEHFLPNEKAGLMENERFAIEFGDSDVESVAKNVAWMAGNGAFHAVRMTGPKEGEAVDSSTLVLNEGRQFALKATSTKDDNGEGDAIAFTPAPPDTKKPGERVTVAGVATPQPPKPDDDAEEKLAAKTSGEPTPAEDSATETAKVEPVAEVEEKSVLVKDHSKTDGNPYASKTLKDIQMDAVTAKIVILEKQKELGLMEAALASKQRELVPSYFMAFIRDMFGVAKKHATEGASEVVAAARKGATDFNTEFSDIAAARREIASGREVGEQK